MSTPVPLNDLLFGLASALIGALVGSTELLSRYRDEPYRALLSRYGFAYLLVNATASAGVYAILVASEALSVSKGWLIVIAGFGAMAVLRSKILTFTTKSQEEIPVGIDAVVKAFLSTADRGVDRDRSDERWTNTYGTLHDVTDPTHLTLLLAHLGVNLRSYQNVSPQEIEDYNQAAAALSQDGALPVSLRCVAAGLAFQALTGSGNFTRVIAEFRSGVGLPPIPA
jgi:hypothetical protein